MYINVWFVYDKREKSEPLVQGSVPSLMVLIESRAHGIFLI